MEKVIVTRHQALVEYIIDQKLAPEGTPVYTHVNPQDIEGKHVLGTLPFHLALNYPARITVIPFTIPQELKGKEIGLEDLKKIAGTPKTVEVKEVPTHYHA